MAFGLNQESSALINFGLMRLPPLQWNQSWPWGSEVPVKNNILENVCWTDICYLCLIVLFDLKKLPNEHGT